MCAVIIFYEVTPQRSYRLRKKSIYNNSIKLKDNKIFEYDIMYISEFRELTANFKKD